MFIVNLILILVSFYILKFFFNQFQTYLRTKKINTNLELLSAMEERIVEEITTRRKTGDLSVIEAEKYFNYINKEKEHIKISASNFAALAILRNSNKIPESELVVVTYSWIQIAWPAIYHGITFDLSFDHTYPVAAKSYRDTLRETIPEKGELVGAYKESYEYLQRTLSHICMSF